MSVAYSKEDDCIAHHNAENEENQTISRHQGNDEDKKIGVLNQRIKKRQKSFNRLNNQYKKTK
ncbi:hypothetical protein [uncultured Gammaproteobacteria bacterium]|nr:hypothetical protein [uncultured Gammaproteobacteria bacterium]